MWLLLSILSAFCGATIGAINKRVLKDADVYLVGWAGLLFGAPFAGALLFFIDIPELNRGFLFGATMSVIVNVIAFILALRSIQIAPLSLVAPIGAFASVFVVPFSMIALKEHPSLYGLAGIASILLGSYSLNLHKISSGFLVPLKELFHQKGSLLMLGAAFFWALAGVFDKIAVQNSSPLFYLASFSILMAVMFSAIVKIKSKNILGQLKTAFAPLIAVGVLSVLTSGFYLLAINYALISYVSAARSLSILFAIFYGRIFFQETNIRERLLGGFFMLAGVILLSLA